MSPEFDCGQIVFNVKNSNLHYMIRETHKSAYITIRKKLIKPFGEISKNEVIDVNVDGNMKNHTKQIEEENAKLRKRNKDVESDLALLRVEIEEIEIQNQESRIRTVTLRIKLKKCTEKLIIWSS